MNCVDLLCSWLSKLIWGDKEDGDRQPEGPKDKGINSRVYELNLSWERRDCLESPTTSTFWLHHPMSDCCWIKMKISDEEMFDIEQIDSAANVQSELTYFSLLF